MIHPVINRNKRKNLFFPVYSFTNMLVKYFFHFIGVKVNRKEILCVRGKKVSVCFAYFLFKPLLSRSVKTFLLPVNYFSRQMTFGKFLVNNFSFTKCQPVFVWK